MNTDAITGPLSQPGATTALANFAPAVGMQASRSTRSTSARELAAAIAVAGGFLAPMTTLGTGINYVGGSESSGTFAPQVNYRDRLEHGPTDSLELAYASHPWMTAVVAAYLSHTHWLRPSTVSTLRQTALELFPGAQISFRLHTDPDEGWNKLVMDVETGIGDIEMRIASEDAFYARLEDSPSLRDSLNDLVIAFA